MAQISNCLKLLSKIDERDQDALVARLDELQAQGVPAERAQIQAAIDVLAAVQGGSSDSNTGLALTSKARAAIKSGVTETPEFKRWFGDSKVVDADGKPLAVYHGTASDFEEFETWRTGRNYGYKGGSRGLFFTSSPDTASVYAEQPSFAYLNPANPGAANFGSGKANIMPVYLRMDRPLETRTKGSPDTFFDSNHRKLIERAEKAGADGIIVRGGAESGRDLFVVFEPKQIKSTIGNSGAFDPNDANITRSATRLPAGVEIIEVEDGFDAMKDGKRIGRLRDNLPRGAAEQLNENASVDIVKVEPEFKGKGVGSALYEAFNEKHGGRIAPSGKTSPEAWALWKRKYPEKVDAFVAAEAARIADGADQSMVIRNISDPEVARRVAEAAPEQVLRSANRQTETPEFKAWFGDSKVVDEDDSPAVVYHGTFDDFGEFSRTSDLGFHVGTALAANDRLKQERKRARNRGRTPSVMPLYASISNPVDISDQITWTATGIAKDLQKQGIISQAEADPVLKSTVPQSGERAHLAFHDYLVDLLKSKGYDGVRYINLVEGARRAKDGDVERVLEVVPNTPGNGRPFVARYRDSGYPVSGGDTAEQAMSEARKRMRREKRGLDYSYIAFDAAQLKSATGNSGAFDPNDANITRSVKRPEFFSQLQRSIEGVPDRLATMAAPQWRLWLDANAPKLGVKKDEIEWSTVKDYLTLRGKDKVTRDELAAYLEGSGVRVRGVVLKNPTALPPSWDIHQDYDPRGIEEWIVTDDRGDDRGSGMTQDEAIRDALGSAGDIGGTKYAAYTIPGGDNYREVLITLPGEKTSFEDWAKSAGYSPREIEEGGDKLRKDFEQRAAGGMKDTNKGYKSSHWDQPNILAHLRIDDRTDADGNKVLFINEIQSDWGQDGKKKGFAAADAEERQAAARKQYRQSIKDDAPEDEQERLKAVLDAAVAAGRGVPAAPFVTDTKAWASLALKRAIMMAVEEGHDKIAFITGAQAADLYDLSKRVDMVSVSPAGDGRYDLTVNLIDGGKQFMRDKSPKDLEDTIGKELAERAITASDSWVAANKAYRDELRKDNTDDAELDRLRAVRDAIETELTGDDLVIGGEGMRAFYDQIIPQVARDVLKKLGGGGLTTATLSHDPNIELSMWEPEDGEGDGSKAAVDTWGAPAFDITPAMREKVASGVPLFSKGRTASGADWESPSASKFDELVYKFQDKQIETKRVVEAIKEASGTLSDDLNVYLNEELYHGRAAKRTEDFVNMELNPLIEDMAKAGMTISDLEEFLHARHAKEANAVIAQRNPGEPGLQDGGSGMTNSEADNYMATLPAADRQKLEAAANKVDAIIGGTRKMFVDYELESQATVDGWDGMFKHYVPLQREDKEGSPGLGQGFSIKGRETKGRTGSTRKVVDILANIAMQRERAIVRGEKNRVAQSLVGLVRANENPEFWLVDEVPTERVFNPATGLVEDRVDPMYKSRENAVVAKIKDPSGAVREHAVLFNEDDPRALRMAQSLKNLDAQQLNGLLGVSAKITRYFAAVNTQYNPVFGVVNLVRDVQGAMLNLSSTPLKNDKAKIAKYTASALAGIYGDMRAARKGKSQTSQWAALWDEFQEVGGQTGYRDLFATSADRADAIQKALDPNAWMGSKLGKVFTAGGALKVPVAQAQKQAGFLFDWLSDYNNAMENGVRLAAYKAGLERGMTKQQAASAAKNLTTNFNRKGQVAQQAGAMYAFFNAAIQGTARIGQTLFDMEPGKPKTLRLSAAGKKIVYGGIVLGSVQALALAAAGFGEEDPPEFARERNLIIPTGGKTYVSIPMPLGMHIIPNIGRVATEFVLSGFKDPIKRGIGLTAMFADAFNPIGNAGMSMQTLAPTALDPLVALTENKDWTGRPIAKTSFNKATPGHALGRDTATALSEVLSESINTLSGGNKYVAGVFSPTPDQIDYLLGQLTGGVGREYSKTEQTLKSAVRGESLPTYKIPLVGRFVGNAKGQASEGSAFYANVDKLNEIETEAKGLRADGKEAEARKLLGENPESYLITQANYAERTAQKLRRQKSELVKAGAPREQVKAIEEEITAVMARLNRAMEKLKTPAESPQ